MAKSYIVMTAMPPTNGHLDLINFAYTLGDDVVVLVCTQPDEPMGAERYAAIQEACADYFDGAVDVRFYNETIPQEPADDPKFWSIWGGILLEQGFEPGDSIVASEPYGQRLAEEVGGHFFPYDLSRRIRYTKATEVREDWVAKWDQILPYFQTYLRKTVTIFGAESVGKTTITNMLAQELGKSAVSLEEYARPYLESVGNELTVHKMNAIHLGQRALQSVARTQCWAPVTIQDTDLFSTLGYWRNWSPGTVPEDLSEDAVEFKSDLYIVLSSNIPFEEDPLRYGGAEREIPDLVWIELLEEFGLNYTVIDANTAQERMFEAYRLIMDLLAENPLKYTRSGAEYRS